MTQTISTASLEYVRVPVSVTKKGVAYDPTNDTVAMAFQQTLVAPTVFYPGVWEATASSFFALCLIGPGSVVQLTAGTWYVWVQITDSPEVPVLLAGVIVVQ